MFSLDVRILRQELYVKFVEDLFRVKAFVMDTPPHVVYPGAAYLSRIRVRNDVSAPAM